MRLIKGGTCIVNSSSMVSLFYLLVSLNSELIQQRFYSLV